MRWIKVSEFCKQEGVSHQGVYAKLNSYRYEQDLKDHVRGYKGKRELDEIAVEILRPKKPTGAPKKSDLDEIKERLAVVEERTVTFRLSTAGHATLLMLILSTAAGALEPPLLS